MTVSNITAACAIIIAVASLAVSILEARAARDHNRKSVKPILHLTSVKTHGESWAGLILTNSGLGPAIVTDTTVRLDGKILGKWESNIFDQLAASRSPAPAFSTLYRENALSAGSGKRLIFIDKFDEARDGWLWELLTHRLSLEVKYDSIYGGEGFVVAKHPWIIDPDTGTWALSVSDPATPAQERQRPRWISLFSDRVRSGQQVTGSLLPIDLDALRKHRPSGQ